MNFSIVVLPAGWLPATSSMRISSLTIGGAGNITKYFARCRSDEVGKKSRTWKPATGLHTAVGFRRTTDAAAHSLDPHIPHASIVSSNLRSSDEERYPIRWTFLCSASITAAAGRLFLWPGRYARLLFVSPGYYDPNATDFFFACTRS